MFFLWADQSRSQFYRRYVTDAEFREAAGVATGIRAATENAVYATFGLFWVTRLVAVAAARCWVLSNVYQLDIVPHLYNRL
jgi:hypothetical protein